MTSRVVVRLAAVLASGVVLAGCGSTPDPGRACTLIGAFNGIDVTVPPPIRARFSTLRLELCQERGCRVVTFPTVRPRRPSSPGDPIGYFGRAYDVDLDALGGHWRPAARARLRLEGRGPHGRVVLRHTETFRFTELTPNGSGCGYFLLHATRVTRSDLVRR